MATQGSTPASSRNIGPAVGADAGGHGGVMEVFDRAAATHEQLMPFPPSK